MEFECYSIFSFKWHLICTKATHFFHHFIITSSAKHSGAQVLLIRQKNACQMCAICLVCPLRVLYFCFRKFQHNKVNLLFDVVISFECADNRTMYSEVKKPEEIATRHTILQRETTTLPQADR